ncbi:hypothetical protein [Clostridium akagii]|uniref:hypothetical protein n=1 Tax=Clostridium akagii TaxID=91623 RepID=UPI00047C343F|nr:hypothetical protein [Clostridium akagii]
MKQKCKKCGKICNIKPTKYIKVFLRRKMIFMCETCEDLVDWKTDDDSYQSNINHFGWDECTLECFDSRLYCWIYKKIIRDKKYCEVKLKGGVMYNCFPVDLKDDYLVCCKDEFDSIIECEVHRRGELEKSLPLNCIQGIKILDIYKDYVESDVEEPVYGFKGVQLINGVLKAHDYIYEIGIPYEEPQRNRQRTDFQDVYSHFCIRIEDVLLNYRDFITSSISFSQGKGYGEERLFVVKGDGHCFQNTNYGWVSNRLTLIREVSKKEIIQYFNNSPDLKLTTEKYFEDANIIYKNVWLEYTKTDIKPYNQFMSSDEIENMLIRSCEYNKIVHCPQNDKVPKFEKCQSCHYYTYDMKGKKKTYSYLIVRNAIQEGTFDETDINYQYLWEHNCKSELEAIQRLLKYKLME